MNDLLMREKCGNKSVARKKKLRVIKVVIVFKKSVYVSLS